MADPRKDSPAVNPFWLTDLYNDARALFAHEHAALEAIKDDCLVFLDANVLLQPCELESKPLAAIEKVYRKLAGEGRLVVPGHAAREYYRHRAGKIAAIADKVQGAMDRLRKPQLEPVPLLDDDPDFAAARDLLRPMLDDRKQAASRLKLVIDRLKSDVGRDRVSALYRELLPPCVFDPEFNANARAQFLTEREARYSLSIAPGYKDEGKPDGGIGDYLIWKTILLRAQTEPRHALFVTNETKGDWWVKSRGPFQPRPELLDEYRQAAGGFSIHLLPLSDLLELFGADQAVIDDVKEVEQPESPQVAARYNNFYSDVLGRIGGAYSDVVASPWIHREWSERASSNEDADSIARFISTLEDEAARTRSVARKSIIKRRIAEERVRLDTALEAAEEGERRNAALIEALKRAVSDMANRPESDDDLPP